MMNKSLNYAYPRKYAEGGDVEAPPAGFNLGGVDNSMITGLKGDVIKQANGRYTFVTYDNAVGKKEGDFKGSGRGTMNNLSEKEFAQMTGIPVGELSGDLVRNPEGQLMTAAMGENDDMAPPRPDGVATTRMVGEEEGMDGFPPPGMATTMAMGEEDGGGLIEPDMPRPPNPFLGLEPDTFTTMAMGEEEGGLPLPKEPGGELTTMAMGEEDGGLPFPPPENPVIAPPPDTGYTPPAMPDAGSFLDMYNPPSVVGPEFSPLPVAPALPQGGSQGRTYGAYSQAGQQAGTTMQPFTPYTPPPQNEGIRSLIDEPVSYLTESGPRSSVFRRS